MAENLITPKFLTKIMAAEAINTALHTVWRVIPPSLLKPKRQECHVVILVPGMKDERASDYPSWPDYGLHPVLLHEQSAGDPEDFEYPFDKIARCKALQLWHDRNDDRTTIIPHLLFPNDTPFWGGVKRRGIVVTCSGVQPWIDKLISGMVADMLVAMAHDAWERSEDKQKDSSFLS